MAVYWIAKWLPNKIKCWNINNWTLASSYSGTKDIEDHSWVCLVPSWGDVYKKTNVFRNYHWYLCSPIYRMLIWRTVCGCLRKVRRVFSVKKAWELKLHFIKGKGSRSVL